MEISNEEFKQIKKIKKKTANGPINRKKRKKIRRLENQSFSS